MKKIEKLTSAPKALSTLAVKTNEIIDANPPLKAGSGISIIYSELNVTISLKTVVPNGNTINDYLRWDGAKWVPGEGIPQNATNEQALVYSSSLSNWVAGKGVPQNATNGQMIKYNSTSGAWEAFTSTFPQGTSYSNGTMLYWNGTSWGLLSPPAAGAVLRHNGSAPYWEQPENCTIV